MAANDGGGDGEEVNSLKDACSEEGNEDQDTFQKIMEMTDDEIRGLEFETMENAIDFYNVYAKCHGFAARKDYVERDHSGDIVVRQLVCNRQGTNNKSRSEKAKNPRPTIRTNCRARFRVAHNFLANKWRVSVFQSSHNHELTPANYVHMIPNYRRLSESDKALVDGLHTHGVKTCHIMGFMLAQKGGYIGLGFCKKDLYNYLNGQVRVRIEDGDAFAALSYLQAKGDNDPMFYAKFTTTSEGKLENLFWSDSTSRTDYGCFGDVIAFDTTYKKNKYNKPLVIFCGYNHHGETTIFGCALVADESAPTYKWVLNTFLDAMYHKHPKAVVTDGDLAMREAIRDVFPDSMHRLCSWHLNKNACENIKMPKFLEEFNTLVKKDVASKKDEKAIPTWLSVMFATKQTLNLTPEECALAAYVFGSPTNKKIDEEELLVEPKINHCVGKRNMFQCLKPIQMLDMDIIDLYVSMLTFNEKKDRSHAKYWFLPTVFSQFVQARQLSTSTLRLSYKDKFMGKVDQVSKIFIPVHDSVSMHWFLLVIDIVNQKLIYLDSLPSDSTYARRKISIKNLANVMEELFFHKSFYDKETSPKPNVSEYQITTPKDLGKQANNSNDCGIWVITWMKELRKNEHKIKVDDGTRLKIALDLIMDSHNQLNQEILKRARGMD